MTIQAYAIHFPYGFLRNGIARGMLGGLAATVVMDLMLVSSFFLAGMPPFTCFSIVGDTAARLFGYQEIAGSAPLGAAVHYLVGPALGALFSAAVRSVPALRGNSRKKVIIFAVLYTEILSQPLLALTPILLRMTTAATLQWYGGSFAMHLVWGIVLGVVWSRGLPVAENANEK